MARIVVEAGDSRTSYIVEVLERVAAPDKLQIQQAFIEPVALTRNGARAWPVGPGRYEVSFIPDDSLEHAVLLAATGANCARYSDGRAHLSCVVRDRARVFVAMPEASSGRESVTGRLVIRRLGDPSVTSDYWFDSRAYAFVK
jgi:hypothetical protein